MAYKLVACKKCKALIIIIIPILALHNISLLTELNWERKQIRHATVKKYCVIIYGIWTFLPRQLPLGQLLPMKFLEDNWTSDFSPGKLPLDIFPWTTSPHKILPKKITLWTFALWIISLLDNYPLDNWPPWNFLQGNFPLDFWPRTFFPE